MTIYEDSNTPPKFAKQVDSVFKVILIIGVDGEIEDDSEVKYTSPIAIDEQEDRILMRFKGEKYFIKVKKNSDDSFFIKVNKRFLPQKSANYPITIELEDDRGARNLVKSTITVEVSVIFKKIAEVVTPSLITE